MDPIQLLMSEHRLIEQVLDALDTYADALSSGGAAEPADLARFVSFIREFADAKHHAKEEELLFAALVDHGFPKEAGPIAVMLHEHELGRRHMRVLAESSESPEWDGEERARIATAAREYTSLLRSHIQKEDNVLYPMAVARLPGEVMSQVAKGCARVEEEHASSGSTARGEGLARELASRYAT